jgi:hypothetical protein
LGCCKFSVNLWIGFLSLPVVGDNQPDRKESQAGAPLFQLGGITIFCIGDSLMAGG